MSSGEDLVGGASNGVGLAMNARYLYASFTDPNTIGTFQVKAGCKIRFAGDITVGGLQGGVIDGMAVRGNMLVATYGDGSIESFTIGAGGKLTANSDQQLSVGYNTYGQGRTYQYAAVPGDTVPMVIHANPQLQTSVSDVLLRSTSFRALEPLKVTVNESTVTLEGTVGSAQKLFRRIAIFRKCGNARANGQRRGLSFRL